MTAACDKQDNLSAVLLKKGDLVLQQMPLPSEPGPKGKETSV